MVNFYSPDCPILGVAAIYDRFQGSGVDIVYTHLSIKDTAADVERLNPIPTGQHSQRQQATGTDGRSDSMPTSGTADSGNRSVGKHWGKQLLETQGISGDNDEIGVFGHDTEKACETLRFAGLIEGG